MAFSGGLPLDEVAFFDVVTHNPATGARASADATPTFDVFEEDTDTAILAAQAMTLRTSATGIYRGTFTASAANGFEVGKWYSVISYATVNGVTAQNVAMSFRLLAAELVAGYPLVDNGKWLGGTIPAVTTTGVPLVDTKYITGTLQTAKDVGGAVPSVAAGASGGLLISGSNSGTTTLAALTITGATTHTGATVHTGNVLMSDGLTIAAPSTVDRAGITVTGNGTGAGIIATGGATGDGVKAVGGASGHGVTAQGTGTTKHGVNAVGGTTTSAGIAATGGATSGDGMLISAGASGHGINTAGVGTTKHGITAAGGSTTSHGINATGGGVGHGILATSGGGATGDGIRGVSAATAGNGLNLLGNGTGNGVLATGGAGAGGDGIEAAAGGGVDFRANQTGSITGNLSGSVGSVTGAVGSVTGAVGSVTGLTASDVGAIKTKTDFLPSATAGAAGGVFIAGTNAATTVTTALTTTFTGNLTGSVGSVTGAVGSVAAGGITASSIAADAIGASELAADAAAEIAAAVWDLDATAHQTQGTFGQAIGDPGADTDTIWALANTNLDATVSSRLASASYTAPPTAAQNATAVLTTQMTESYAANGVAPTLAQASFGVHQYLMQFGISGTSYTVKKLDNATTAFVVTLNDATSPTGAART